jgi:hypothetical protein
MVRCRYSPATARMPRINENTETRPACAMARSVFSGVVGSAALTYRPLTPAAMTAWATASSSNGLRTVRSFSSSARMSVSIGRPLQAAVVVRSRKVASSESSSASGPA